MVVIYELFKKKGEEKEKAHTHFGCPFREKKQPQSPHGSLNIMATCNLALYIPGLQQSLSTLPPVTPSHPDSSTLKSGHHLIVKLNSQPKNRASFVRKKTELW